MYIYIEGYEVSKTLARESSRLILSPISFLKMSEHAYMYIYIYIYIHVFVRDEKEGRKKQAKSNKQQGMHVYWRERLCYLKKYFPSLLCYMYTHYEIYPMHHGTGILWQKPRRGDRRSPSYNA